MQNKIDLPDWQAVASHYDNKGTDDLNYLSAVDKRIVHHHSGIFQHDNDLLTRAYTEAELLHLLGVSEDRLTHLGARMLDLKPGRGFDCGCGKGGSTFILARDYGHNMLGITISPAQLEYARSMSRELHLEQQSSFELLNIYESNLDYWQGEFDFIWACESTEYMPDYYLLFQKWNGLLKKKGKALLFALAYRESQKTFIAQELACINGIYETRIGTLHAYLQAAIAAGFEIDDYIDLGDKIIPYYRLRLQSRHRRGSETALLKGLENGYFKYFLLVLRKLTPSPAVCSRPVKTGG